jgi:hypothetical protein
VARATRDDVLALLREGGASEAQAERIVAALAAAGLAPPRMRSWLSHPERGYSVSVGFVLMGVEWMQKPLHAIELGFADAVVEATEEYAAASPDERFIALTCACDLQQVRRMTHGDPDRTAMVVRIARLLLARLRKDVHVHDTLKTTLSGDYDDLTRLADWMTDERLPAALEALESDALDPVALHATGMIFSARW